MTLSVRRVLLIPLLLASFCSEACFIMITRKDGRVLVGNNEDWYHSDAKYWMESPKAGKSEKYKAIFFGFKGEFTTAQGGMNERGLFFDATAVPQLVVSDSAKIGRKKAIHPIFKIILKKCATVEEAVIELQHYYIPFIRKVQIIMADANGDYLVMNVNGIAEKGHLEDGYRLITNFHSTDKNHFCYRYDSAENRLRNRFEGSPGQVIEILSLSHQEFPGATVYSNVYDLTRASVTTYYNHRFGEGISADFHQELKKPEYLEEHFRQRMIEELIHEYEKRGVNGALNFFDLERNKPESKYICDAEQLSDLTTRLLNRGKFPDALSVARRNVQLFPESDRANEQLGKALFYNRQIQSGLSAYRQALLLNPGNRWATAITSQFSQEPAGNVLLKLNGFPTATLVNVAGNFNEWQSLQNICFKNVAGEWECRLDLPPGRYFYRFLVDGKWIDDPFRAPVLEIEKGFFVSEFVVP